MILKRTGADPGDPGAPTPGRPQHQGAEITNSTDAVSTKSFLVLWSSAFPLKQISSVGRPLKRNTHEIEKDIPGNNNNTSWKIAQK